MIKLYSDSALTEEIEGNTIHLGTVEVGTTVVKEIYIVNDSDGVLTDILVTLDPIEKGLIMDNIPTTIEPRRYDILKLIWSPPLDMRKALTTTINIKGNEMYYA